MKLKISLLISFVFFLLIFTTSTYAYTISGNIRNSDTLVPISGATLRVETTSGNLIGSTTTNTNGFYSLTINNIAGVYNAKASALGYIERSKPFYNSIEIESQSIDFALKSSGSITPCTDNDHDNYGAQGTDLSQCTGSTTQADCNDNNPAVKPGATEICNGIDDDCDTQIDEGVKTTYYRDADSDTFGNPSITIQACTVPAGYVTNSNDCDDSNSNVRPDSSNPCLDCNPATICSTCTDNDGDKYGVGDTTPCIYTQTDCNDNNININPGASDICGNGIDENCDGSDASCGGSSGGGGGGGGGDTTCSTNLRDLTAKETTTTRNLCIIYFTYDNTKYSTKIESVSSNNLTLSLSNNKATALLNNQARLPLTSTKDLIFTYDKLDYGKITVSLEVGAKQTTQPTTTTSTPTQTTPTTITPSQTTTQPKTPTTAAIVSGIKKPAIGIGIMLAIILIGSVIYYVFAKKQY